MKKLLFILIWLFCFDFILQAQTVNLRVKNLNNIRYSTEYSGADRGAKLASALTDLQAKNGGIVYDLAETSGAWNTCPFTGITDPITVVISGYTITDNVLNCTVPSNITLEFLNSGNITVNTPNTLTIDSYLNSGSYQIFSGTGSFIITRGLSLVYPEWWGAKNDGATNSSSAFNSAVASIKGSQNSGGPNTIQLQGGTYKVEEWTFDGVFGIVVQGRGAGSAFAQDFRTKLLGFGNINKGIINVNPETSGIDFYGFEIDCGGTRPAGSVGIWLKRNGMNNHSTQQVWGHKLTLTNCDTGWKNAGDTGGFINYNNNGCLHCDIVANNYGYANYYNNGEWQRWDHSRFINNYLYNVYGDPNAGSVYECDDCYFGTFQATAIAGLQGKFAHLYLNKFVSEIDQRVRTIDIQWSGSGFQFCQILGSEFATKGDTNDYVIAYEGATPCTIEGSRIAGKIKFDSRNNMNGVYLPATIIQPAFSAETVLDVDPGNGCTAPELIGRYTDATDINYYIHMYSATTFRWKRGSAPTGAETLFTIPGTYKNYLEKGLIASFQVGCNYTNGTVWHWPVRKSGTEDVSSRTDNNIRIKVGLTANFAIPNGAGATIVKFDGITEDWYGMYSAVTGQMTAWFPGELLIHCLQAFDLNAGGIANISIFKNGAVFSTKTMNVNATNQIGLEITASVPVVADDAVDCRITNDAAAPVNALGGFNVSRFDILYQPHTTGTMR